MKTDSFKDHVLDSLRALDGIECRAMFGGHGLYCVQSFFGILFKGVLYFKVSPATKPEYERQGTKPFQPSTRQTLKSFYEVPAAVVENGAELTRWARAAIEASHGK